MPCFLEKIFQLPVHSLGIPFTGARNNLNGRGLRAKSTPISIILRTRKRGRPGFIRGRASLYMAFFSRPVPRAHTTRLLRVVGAAAHTQVILRGGASPLCPPPEGSATLGNLVHFIRKSRKSLKKSQDILWKSLRKSGNTVGNLEISKKSWKSHGNLCEIRRNLMRSRPYKGRV